MGVKYWPMRTFLIWIFGALLVPSVAVAKPSAQTLNGYEAQDKVVLTKLFQPYPPPALQTRVTGDVQRRWSSLFEGAGAFIREHAGARAESTRIHDKRGERLD